jgi:2-oxoglutarate ferredoxin oxidoreductase subunit gamma
MIVKSFFAGFGGQGIILMGYSLAYCGMKEGQEVTCLPSYGAEVRGGTANCTVVLGDEEIASPIASEPEFVIVMNTPSMTKFQNHLSSGGQLFLNSSLIEERPVRGDIEVYAIPATKIAEDLGNAKAANMIMLGAFIRKSGLVKMETLLDHMEGIFGEGRKKIVPFNRKAAQAGFDHMAAHAKP